MILRNGIQCFDNLQNCSYNGNTNLKLRECKIERESDSEQHIFETSNKQYVKLSEYNLYLRHLFNLIC
jgi:hypothetical protein